MSVKKLTLLALFTAISMSIYAIESAIPPLVPIPGIKLGLANIITLIMLHFYSCKDTLLVLSARILLSSLLFGQALSLIYSLAGGLLSLMVMAFTMKLLRRKFCFLTGALGGVAHNMGQLITAYAITATPGVFGYLPYFLLGGILTGLFTGFCAGGSTKYLAKYLNRL